MKKKTFAGLGGQLSRTQMKAVTAGKPLPPGGGGGGQDCSVCQCSNGGGALYAGPWPEAGPWCYCPNGDSISGSAAWCN